MASELGQTLQHLSTHKTEQIETYSCALWRSWNTFSLWTLTILKVCRLHTPQAYLQVLHAKHQHCKTSAALCVCACITEFTAWLCQRWSTCFGAKWQSGVLFTKTKKSKHITLPQTVFMWVLRCRHQDKQDCWRLRSCCVTSSHQPNPGCQHNLHVWTHIPQMATIPLVFTPHNIKRYILLPVRLLCTTEMLPEWHISQNISTASSQRCFLAAEKSHHPHCSLQPHPDLPKRESKSPMRSIWDPTAREIFPLSVYP